MDLELTTHAARPAFVRPIVAAIALTVIGEAAIFLVWGLVLYPGQNLWVMAAWTAICGVSLGAIIGAFVDVVVTGRLAGRAAFAMTALIWFVVLAACTYLCYRVDLATGGRFGARQAPALFLSAGLIPAFLASFLYAWLVTFPKGQRLLSRMGL
jgi:hypothetical protein